MIVVDTSVWIDVLSDRDTAPAERCVALLQDGAPLALTEVIYSELLQGVRDDKDSARLDRCLRAFPILRLDSLDDFALAARLHRRARAAGITIRKTLDCLIAAALRAGRGSHFACRSRLRPAGELHRLEDLPGLTERRDRPKR